MLIAASGDGQSSSEDEDSAELHPSGVVAAAELDPELTAVLSRAAARSGLEACTPPSLEPSQRDDWLLGTGRGSRPRPALVPFFPEVHEELMKLWTAPFYGQKRLVCLLTLARDPSCQRPRECGWGTAGPPHAPLASPNRDSGSSARMSQNAGPSVPSSLTPIRCTTAGTSIVPLEPLARRLEAWLALPSPSRWLTHTIWLGYAIQFARRPPKFSGVLETALAARNAPVLREEIAVLLARMQSSRSLQPRWGRGFTALISSYPRKAVVFDQSWIATPEPGPAQAPVQDVDAQAHDQMHTAPGLVCSDRPEGCLLSCFDPSATQTVPTVCVRGSGMAVQGPPLWALPVPPCLHEGRGGCPCPVMGSGHQDPQLSRAWPARENSCAITGTWCFGTSASWGFGSTGKRASSPLRRESLFLVWSRLGEYDGAPHGRACPISAELPEFLQRQDCGFTETVSEAPGAYGIRSCSHAARIASYETTSALVALPSPEGGHGAAVHFGWISHRSVAAPLAPGQTLPFYGPGCP